MKKIIAALAVSLIGISGVAKAEYPERPVLLMIPYGAGGATDFQARIATIPAGNDDMLGMPVAIINKPGAGGRVGWNWFANDAEKDGYTMGGYNVPHFIAQSIKGGVDYSTDSFEPIANWGSDPAVFVVGKDSNF
ncbi:tripartite tricarboxylate transporter substrate-binding protein, partial [Amylibacter sp.]|nr:tripartite tricarboxylate transporter substrate-binding protein [Amylibacter sp.]